jgi:hypothetical protein
MFTAMVLVGTVLNTGSPCPQVRTSDGQLVQTVGLPSSIQTGDHVRISGKMRYSFSCQADVLAVQSVEKTTP